MSLGKSNALAQVVETMPRDRSFLGSRIRTPRVIQGLPDNPPLYVGGLPAGSAFGTVERTAARFTLLVGNVAGLYRKLEFEHRQFSRAHHEVPPDVDGIIYNCLNFLVTAQSLYDWFRSELQERDGSAFSLDAFNILVAQRLHYHGLCRDIANTLKHRDFRDGLWPGGSVKLDYLPGDGVTDPVAVLIFNQPGNLNIDAQGLLTIILYSWGFLLRDYGFLPGPRQGEGEPSAPK